MINYNIGEKATAKKCVATGRLLNEATELLSDTGKGTAIHNWYSHSMIAEITFRYLFGCE